MSRICVQTEDFNLAEEVALLTNGRTDIGGVGCFIGVVREDKADEASQRVIKALTLEHYPAMTMRAIRRITDEAERRWSLLGCTVIHRVGRCGGLIALPGLHGGSKTETQRPSPCGLGSVRSQAASARSSPQWEETRRERSLTA